MYPLYSLGSKISRFVCNRVVRSSWLNATDMVLRIGIEILRSKLGKISSVK